MGILIFLQYFREKYLSYPFVLTLFIPAGLYLSYLVADLYGLSIFIASLISASPAIFSLFIFSFATDNLELIAETIDIPAEQKKIATKLDNIGKAITEVNGAYLWLAGAFSLVGFYILYQNEVDSRLIQGSFSLDNPHTIIGIFLSIAALFWGIRYVFPRFASNGKQEGSVPLLDANLFRAASLALFGLMLAPAVLALALGAEVYSGFFLGIIASVVLVTAPGSLFDIRTKTNYSAITKREEILFRIKILGPVSLLLVIFLL